MLNLKFNLNIIMKLQGYLIEANGDMISVQPRRNETSLHIRGGSVIFKQDCMHTAFHSSQTFIDIIIALNRTDNFTARGDLFIDDSTKKSNISDFFRDCNKKKYCYIY